MAKVSARGGRGGVGLGYYLSYVERGGESGRWLGGGAATLGLSGEVSADGLVAVGEGRHPVSGVGLVVGRGDRVPAWDVTFSAPKSVSVLYGLAGGDARGVLKAAHDGAVKAAVGWLEAHGGRARRGPGGRDGHVAVELVVAAFAHGTSRAVDPDLHTHCLVANMGVDATGRWSSIDSRVLYRRRMAAGAVYRAELRRATAALGLEWRPANSRGLSELVGVPQGLLRVFSKRRVQIERELARHATVGPRAGDAAALATRAAKVDVEFVDAQGRWRAEAASFGWTAERAENLVLGGRTRTVTEAAGADRELLGLLLGPMGLTRAQAAFTHDDVIRGWAALLPAGATAGELDRLARVTLADPAVLAVAHPGDESAAGEGGMPVAASPLRDALTERRYTTVEMAAVEERLVAWAEAGRGGGHAQVGSVGVERGTAGAGLVAEQAAMVADLCGSGDVVSVVVGVPGSGKTTALGVAARLWERAGYRVVGCALAGRAADELARGAHLGEAATIDSFLQTTTAAPVDERTVVIVDEAAMVDTRRLALVADRVRRCGGKLVLVGDDRQLPAIGAGGGFTALATRLGATRLRGNRRQVDVWQQQALADIRDGRTAEAVAAYLDHGKVTVADTPLEVLEMMVGDWWAVRQAGDEVAMYAYTRDAAAHLNHAARTCLAGAGELGDRVMRAPGTNRLGVRVFAAGDDVVCLRNQRRLPRDPDGVGVRNGTFATIIDVHPDHLVAQTGDGRVLHLPAGYVRTAVDYGYATSLHKGQGRTVGAPAAGRRGTALIFGASGLTAESALVAASRATHDTCLYVIGIPPPEPTSHGTPERIDARNQLTVGWSRTDTKTAAIDQLNHAKQVRTLAEQPQGMLVAELQRLTDTLDQPDVDRRALLAERDIVVAARQLQHQQRRNHLAVDPPAWLTDLIGQPPTPAADPARRQTWWQALHAIIDLRPPRLDDRTPASLDPHATPWERAVGVDRQHATNVAPGAVAVIQRARRHPTRDRTSETDRQRRQAQDRARHQPPFPPTR